MPSGPDLEWRCFWRVGPRPVVGGSRYAELNAAPVTPKVCSITKRSLVPTTYAYAACLNRQAFPQWTEVMDSWGQHMMNAVSSVAEMAALGYALPLGNGCVIDSVRSAPKLP